MLELQSWKDTHLSFLLCQKMSFLLPAGISSRSNCGWFVTVTPALRPSFKIKTQLTQTWKKRTPWRTSLSPWCHEEIMEIIFLLLWVVRFTIDLFSGWCSSKFRFGKWTKSVFCFLHGLAIFLETFLIWKSELAVYFRQHGHTFKNVQKWISGEKNTGPLMENLLGITVAQWLRRWQFSGSNP